MVYFVQVTSIMGSYSCLTYCLIIVWYWEILNQLWYQIFMYWLVDEIALMWLLYNMFAIWSLCLNHWLVDEIIIPNNYSLSRRWNCINVVYHMMSAFLSLCLNHLFNMFTCIVSHSNRTDISLIYMQIPMLLHLLTIIPPQD